MLPICLMVRFHRHIDEQGKKSETLGDDQAKALNRKGECNEKKKCMAHAPDLYGAVNVWTGMRCLYGLYPTRTYVI